MSFSLTETEWRKDERQTDGGMKEGRILKKTFNKEGSRRQKWREYVLESERNLLLPGIFRLK